MKKDKNSKIAVVLLSITTSFLILAPLSLALGIIYSVCFNGIYEKVFGFYTILAISSPIIILIFPGIKRIYKNIAFILGVLLFLESIGIPNFMPHLRVSAAKHCKADANLKLIYKAEKEFYSRNGEYSASFEKLKWERKDQWFCYQFSETEIIKPPTFVNCTLPPGIRPFVSKDKFLIVAVGNIDNDATLDVWSIDEKKELKNLVDDVKL